MTSNTSSDVNFVENEKLIILVQEQTSLYKMNDPMCQNKNCQDLLWKQVGDSLGTSDKF